MLTYLARDQGKEDACVEKIFSSYFEAGEDLNRIEVITRIAEECGVTGAAEYVDLPSSNQRVMQEVNIAYKKGISGVPHFIIKGPNSRKAIEVSGGQPPEQFSRIFQRLGAQ